MKQGIESANAKDFRAAQQGSRTGQPTERPPAMVALSLNLPAPGLMLLDMYGTLVNHVGDIHD